jgi:1-acyl-sn-glycerol-3-phosphate acyltransferase
MFFWFVYLTLWPFARIFFRLGVRGIENIPPKGPFILAGNHKSHLDPPLVTLANKRKLFFLTKKENWLFAIILRGINCIELDREGIDRAALKRALKALHEGRGLLIFPEGTRSLDGKMTSGKLGVALIAIATNVPVIPTFVEGTERSMPPGTIGFKGFYKARVIFGRKIYPPTDINREKRKVIYQQFTDTIMREIALLGKKDD